MVHLLTNSLKRSSYYEADYRQSAALIRARRPFLFRNIMTGTGIAMFAVGVCTFFSCAVPQVFSFCLLVRINLTDCLSSRLHPPSRRSRQVRRRHYPRCAAAEPDRRPKESPGLRQWDEVMTLRFETET